MDQGRLRGSGAVHPLLPPLDGLDSPRIRLRFRTPTRLVLRGQLQEGVTFRELAFLMLRRPWSSPTSTSQEPPWTGPSVPIWTGGPCHPDRRSGPELEGLAALQQPARKKMSLGGFVGTLDLEGDLAPSSRSCAPPKSSISAKEPPSDWERSSAFRPGCMM